MSTCGNPMTGGRRTRKMRKTKSRKQRGGNMYSGVPDPQLGSAGLGFAPVTNNGASTTGAIPASDIAPQAGGRRRGMSMKTMKRMLKKNGMKVSGRKSTLTKRMKKARLMKGGASQYLPNTANSGFTGAGVARGMGGFQDVSGSAPRANDVVPLPA